MNNMDMENKTKQTNGILIGIIFLIVGLALGFGVTTLLSQKNDDTKETQKEEVKEENKNIDSALEEVQDNCEEEKYTYENIYGKYEYIINGESNITHTLYLYENGNFWYDICQMACSGSAGNYIIKDSKVVLNQVIGFGSDAEAYVVEKEVNKELTIEKSNLKLEETEVLDFSKTNIEIRNIDFFDKLNRRIISTVVSSESE